jgi:hypothetical protein
VKPDEPTVKFGVSKFLMSVDGPSATLGLLISLLYGDKTLPKTEWSVSHTAANRPAFIKQLRDAGTQHRRLGFAVHTQRAVDEITKHAKGLRLNVHTLMTHKDKSG